MRCIVGPVGSGKTTGAAWEICYYLPQFLFKRYGIRRSRWAIIRNTSIELRDTTLKTIQEWFPFGHYKKQAMEYDIHYPNDVHVELYLRACDNEKHVRQFKSFEITGYWIDESIEVADATKKMLKNRIGRYPRKSPVRFGIETTNPPDIEHSTYTEFAWISPPPGPIPSGKPLKNHVGFWQPPYENIENLRVGYYDDMRNDYADNPDWIDMYIEGKPGQLVQGKLVYKNFNRNVHVSDISLVWDNQALYRGWDHSGNTPACVVVCPISASRLHVLKEFHTIQENIVDFANRVIFECNEAYPGAHYTDYGDPAGSNKFSSKDGTMTSNTQLVSEECQVTIIPGEQTFSVRINVVDQALLRRDGMLIDPSCTRLINGLIGGYHFPEIKGMPGVYRRDVAKNKYSHVHDALQYVLTRLHVSAAPEPSEADLYPDDDYEEIY